MHVNGFETDEDSSTSIDSRPWDAMSDMIRFGRSLMGQVQGMAFRCSLLCSLLDNSD